MPGTGGTPDASDPAEADSARPPSAEARGDERRFRVYTLAVLTSGIVTATLVSLLWQPFHGRAELWWIGPVLALSFLLAEQLGINVDVRSGISWTISFTEIPLVIGFFVAPFEVVLAAHLVAGISTLLVRRVSGRVLYNAGAFLLEITSAFAVAGLVQHAAGTTEMTWPAALAGTLTAPLASTLLALAAVRVLRRRMRIGTALRLTGRILVVGFVNASVGLSGYLVIVGTSNAWPLVVAVFLGLSALYWAYSDLLREQRDMEALSDVSLMVARSGQQAAARPASRIDDLTGGVNANDWSTIAERIKDQLSAARVVLRLRLEPTAAMTTVVAGEPLPGAGQVGEDALVRLPGSHVRHFRSTEANADVADALLDRGAQEALVVPLRSANQLLGVVEAHDRLSRWRGFGKYDVQLLGTMASHLATALDNRRLLATLRHDAYHDPLTGLLNRPGFRQVAREPLRERQDAAVLRVDLDVFSTVSDALGYTWADRMVIAAGRRLRDALGQDVPLARLEGASFAALLTGYPSNRIHEVAERLRAQLSAPYPVDRLTVEANAMVGYATQGGEEADSADIDALLQRADVAVRATRGGEEVRAYVPSMGQIFLRRFQMVTQFRQALEEGQLSVHYQPKISLPSKQVLGVEALVRWVHPEFGKLDPDEFVPAVEAAGLIGVLTGFVLEESLKRVRKWMDEGLRISVAVNLSVRNLADEDFPAKVVESLRRFDVPSELLTFELTESGVMADPQKALPILQELHALGIVLAVDDFGTGYSSLAYLRRLPVDEVKIDKSFVLGMGTDLGDLAVVRSIVELGHSLGLTVVAEGVEEDIARDQLEAMGCDVAQGYLISRPLAEDRLEAWLQARTARSAGRHRETVLTLLT
ncbi:diguanylate cyclase (GGDEF)-like protein [Amycolatopsis bartoniae]|uniref:Bifunctional diguanylate cyclase/phosphodiesterase n=1 Tax=Amycolatopsis bartoniae TaxID=941986 RepID=A0A8H9MFG8_9PSEU|nr:EAL domain-containing protein [Amycolatopsis bartoniae]MBB2933795.1 diguanylate cyclase (GGDEF)-like protein [Amycolatopsis bartoniae]TVT10546.1 EAL domain-containing protein [Amycolatopsis bartoniae]GHF71668.1 bifunctional diguanylate cyclase/phosphodiesterase [Amycolatopsis bartoniae]